MKEYSIGQVLFTLMKGDTSIHPVLVTEEVRKKTLQGSTTEYTVELVLKNGKRSHVVLSEIEAQVFDRIDDARSFLLGNATRAINEICDTATRNSDKWFSTKTEQELPVRHINTELAEEVPMVELGNGVVARVRLPPSLQ